MTNHSEINDHLLLKQMSLSNKNISRAVKVNFGTMEPKDWSATATGQFTDIQTAQKSIRVLKANYTGHRMDIEFIYEGKLRDFNGNESLKYIECR